MRKRSLWGLLLLGAFFLACAQYQQMQLPTTKIVKLIVPGCK